MQRMRIGMTCGLLCVTCLFLAVATSRAEQTSSRRTAASPATYQVSDDDAAAAAEPDALEALVATPTDFFPTGRYAQHPFVRAGCPQNTAWYAIPSINPLRYSAGYVGGGAAIGGEPRYADEGTWGLDYHGLLPKRIWLNWYHGRKYQGGTKGYKTDGPRLHLGE